MATTNSPGGTVCSATGGPGGPLVSATDGPGGLLIGGTVHSMTGYWIAEYIGFFS